MVTNIDGGSGIYPDYLPPKQVKTVKPDFAELSNIAAETKANLPVQTIDTKSSTVISTTTRPGSSDAHIALELERDKNADFSAEIIKGYQNLNKYSDNYKNLNTEGIKLHQEAEKVAHGKGKTLARLKEIPQVFAAYKKLGDKFDIAISDIDKDIKKIEDYLKTSPDNQELKNLLKYFVSQKTELLKLKTDFSFAEAGDASEIAKESNFHGYRANVNKKSRGQLLEEAKSDLNNLKSQLETEISSFDLQLKSFENSNDTEKIKDITQKRDSLKSRLDYVNYMTHAVEKDSLTFANRVTTGNSELAHRISLIKDIPGKLNDIADKYDLNSLVVLALHPDGNPDAVKKLFELRDEMVKTLTENKEAYIKLHPSINSVNAMNLFIEKLGKYNFNDIKQIKSFEDQVKDINKDIAGIFRVMEKDLLTPAEETKELKNLDNNISNQFDNKDLTEKRIDAHQLEYLERLTKSSSLAKAEVAVLADYYLENKSQEPEMLNDKIKTLREDITNVRGWYAELVEAGDATYSWKRNPDKKGLLKDNIPVKIMDLLVKKTDMLKAGKTADFSKIDAEINHLMSISEDPDRKLEYANLKQIIANVDAIAGDLAYEKRIVTTLSSAEEALTLANKKAMEERGTGFAVLDAGWKDNKHQGYIVAKYPAGSIEEKMKQVKQNDSSLIHLSVTDEKGNLKSEGRINQAVISDSNFRHGTLDKSLATLNNKGEVSLLDVAVPVSANKLIQEAKELEAKQDVILAPVGKKAKELALKHYDEAIDLYDKMTKDDTALVETVFKALGADKTKNGEYFRNMFGLNPYISQGGPKTSHIVADQFMKFYYEYNAADNKEAALEKFRKTDAYKAVKRGAADRLENLFDSRSEVTGTKHPKDPTDGDREDTMDDAEAALVLTRDFPGIRQEIYRQFDFKIDPGLGVPPYSDGDDVDDMVKNGRFSSNAEMVFVHRAESWGDTETAKSVGKTAGLIAGTIALGMVTGGLGAGVGIAAMTTTSVLMAGYEVYKSEKQLDKAEANYSSGLIGVEGLRQAEASKTFSYVSAVIQVATGGASMAIGKTVNPQTLRGAIALDLAVGAGSTAMDPSSYAAGAKGFLLNIVVGGVVSYASAKTGSILGPKHLPGEHLDVHFGPDNQAFVKHPETGEQIKVNPVEITGNKVTFEIPSTKEKFTVDVNKTAAEIIAKPKSVGEPPAVPKTHENITAKPETKPETKVNEPVPQQVPQEINQIPVKPVNTEQNYKPGDNVKLGDSEQWQVIHAGDDGNVVLAKHNPDDPANPVIKTVSREELAQHNQPEVTPKNQDTTAHDNDWSKITPGTQPKDTSPVKVPKTPKNIEPYTVSGNKKLMAELKPDPLISKEGAANQLKLLSRDNPNGMYHDLPTLDQLVKKGAVWKGVPEDAVLFQTYYSSEGVQYAKNSGIDPSLHDAYGRGYGSKRLLEYADKLNAHHYGNRPDVNYKKVGTNPDGVTHSKGYADDHNRVPAQVPEGPKPGVVSGVARAGNSTEQIMLEEMAMLRDADVIYFGLTGEEGKFPDSVTTGELQAVLNDPVLRNKVVFFKIDP
jgi:hypothetical protein